MSIMSIVEYNSVKLFFKWCKCIGYFFYVIKFRLGFFIFFCYVVFFKVEGIKVRKYGWMVRILIRRKFRKSKI